MRRATSFCLLAMTLSTYGCAVETRPEPVPGERTDEVVEPPVGDSEESGVSSARDEMPAADGDPANSPFDDAGLVGDSCDAHDECFDGFCGDGVCQAWSDLGDPCGGLGTFPESCGTGQTCVYMVESLPDYPGHCADDCIDDADCGEGMACTARPEGDVCLPAAD